MTMHPLSPAKHRRALDRAHAIARSGIVPGVTGIHPLDVLGGTSSTTVTGPMRGTVPGGTRYLLPGAPALWTRVQPSTDGPSHWADVAMADAWLREAMFRSSDGQRSVIDAMPDEASQENAVVAQWDAIGKIYRALNIPPTICPSYRGIYFDWIGSASGQGGIPESLSQHIGALVANPLPLTTISAQRIRDTTHQPPPYSIIMPLRVNLAQDATIATNCMGSPASSWTPLCNAADAGDRGDTLYYPPVTTPGNVPWNMMRTNYAPDPAGFGNNILRVTPPAEWFFDMGAALVHELAALGATEILRRAIANQVLLNLKTAANANPPMVPEQLAAHMASLPADFEHLRWHNEQRATIDTFLTTAATVAHLVPGYGTLVSGLIIGLKAIIDALPSAVGVAVDPWGRATPVYEFSSISATGVGGRPDYDLNGPNGFIRPPAGTPAGAPITSPGMSNTGKAVLAVGGAIAGGWALDAMGVIDLGKLFRRR